MQASRLCFIVAVIVGGCSASQPASNRNPDGVTSTTDYFCRACQSDAECGPAADGNHCLCADASCQTGFCATPCESSACAGSATCVDTSVTDIEDSYTNVSFQGCLPATNTCSGSGVGDGVSSTLVVGASFATDTELQSPNGDYQLVMQGDGNLCIYRQPGRQYTWCSNSASSNGSTNGQYSLVMQDDGNLCIYQQPGKTFVWCTMSEATDGSLSNGYVASLQNDGNLCIFESAQAPHAFWCSSPTNTLALTMGAPNGSINDPMATLTICTPGMARCVTVPNIHVDTGSTGLRVFASALDGLPLPYVDLASGDPLGSCMAWVPAFWGSVRRADVVLGTGLAARDVSIQVVDPSFGTLPSSCGTSVATADPSNFNGIWGIGSPSNDCNSGVCPQAWNSYFDCGSGGCASITVDEQDEVVHLVPFLASDNNGLIVHLPAVPAQGAASVTGELIFGIGTRANNTPPASTKVVAVDPTGAFSVIVNGKSYPSGMDTGTWSWDLPYDSADLCAGNAPFLCPHSTLSISSKVIDNNGNQVDTVSFNVESYNALPSSNLVFNDVGTAWANDGILMFGLPFFLGRNVYVGVAGQTSSLGTGPLFGYAPQ
jgi:hypothetical protein